MCLLCRFLAEKGAAVTVTDQAPPEDLSEARRDIAGLAVTEELGVAQPDWHSYDLIVLSPGVPPELPWVRAAAQAGAQLAAHAANAGLAVRLYDLDRETARAGLERAALRRGHLLQLPQERGVAGAIARQREHHHRGGDEQRDRAAVGVDRPGGERLKRIGSETRQELERLWDARVFLELWVKVRSGWADDEARVRSFGYE